MSEKIRLDGYLVATGAAKSRSDAKKLLKKKMVAVGEQTITTPEHKIDPESDSVFCGGKSLTYQKYRYFLLHKPSGYVTATGDAKERTVMELLPFLNPEDYFPVGRLDKDTEGLLLITNNGAFAHRILSPKNHVPKKYFVRVTGAVSEEGKARLQKGISFSEFVSSPAEYEEVRYLADALETEAYLTITEGKYHQVKRMFSAIGNDVVYLKRVSMGALVLPEELKCSEYMELSPETMKICFQGEEL